MGHESASMDDRYTMIDDEAIKDARKAEIKAEIQRLESQTA